MVPCQGGLWFLILAWYATGGYMESGNFPDSEPATRAGTLASKARRASTRRLRAGFRKVLGLSGNRIISIWSLPSWIGEGSGWGSTCQTDREEGLSSRGRRRQRVCKPGSVPAYRAGDDHSSGTSVTRCLTRPTRMTTRKPVCHEIMTRHPYLVLLPVGFTLPFPLPGRRCALTAPFHPCR